MEEEENRNSEDLNSTLFELDSDIDPNYSLTTAVSDMKKGIAYYQKRQWKSAFPFIKRALAKFQNEKQYKLMLECSYLCGSIALQLQSYNNAIPYLEMCQNLSNKLNHTQYWQQVTFNLGYVNYKLANPVIALEMFSKLNPEKHLHINKIHFYIFSGRAHSKLNQFEEAKVDLNKACSILEQLMDAKNNKNQTQLAKIYSELGNIYFNQNLVEIKQKGFQVFESDEFNFRINQAIDHYLKSIEIWEFLEEKTHQIELLHIVGNIYGFLQDSVLQIHYLQRALEIAEEIHDFQKVISILQYLIHYYEKSERYQEIVSLLQNALESFSQYVYVDHIIVAEFQYHMGKALYHLEEYQLALKQLFAALSTYQKMELPIQEELITLNLIAEIYTNQGENENASYYMKKYKEIENKLRTSTLISKSPMGPLKDLWIFTQTGIEIYSHNPNIELNPTLFGGFVSALQSLSQEIAKDALKSFVIGNSRYTFYLEPKENLYILGRSFVSTLESTITKILIRINEAFYDKFRKKIEKFTGDVTGFNTFTETLHNLDLNLL